VGQLPEGFPAFHGIGEPKIIGDVLSTAISVTFVGILESLAIAKSLAAKRKYQVSTNRELVALGVANIVGSMFQACEPAAPIIILQPPLAHPERLISSSGSRSRADPVTGSFSRSAVNFSMGVRTQASGMVAASVVLLTLVLLTSLFTHLPLCALAAIIVSSVVGLFDYSEAKFLWRVKKTDFVLWLASFAGTLFFGVEVGIISAVSALLPLSQSRRCVALRCGRRARGGGGGAASSAVRIGAAVAGCRWGFRCSSCSTSPPCRVPPCWGGCRAPCLSTATPSSTRSRARCRVC
jgi:sulfate transporter 4